MWELASLAVSITFDCSAYMKQHAAGTTFSEINFVFLDILNYHLYLI